MISSIRNAKDRVAHLLKTFPQTRDDDKLLWIAYLVVYHDLKGVLGEEKYQAFKSILMNKKTPAIESIRRIRQKFQELGYYPASKQTQVARQYEQQEVRDWTKEYDK